MDTGLNRKVVGELYDRLRMAAALVAEDQRDNVVFNDCQVECDECVIRKERVFKKLANGKRERTGTIRSAVLPSQYYICASRSSSQ